MLKDLMPSRSVLHIAGRKYAVRFSLNALLCLEVQYRPLSELLAVSFEQWGMEDVLQLCHAAMCSLPHNSKAVNRRDFDCVRPTLSELGERIAASDLPLLRLELINAIIDSLPPKTGDEEEPTHAMNEGHQRAMYVDVMHRPEREFWRSTNKEIAQRIDCYLETKGLKEPPVQLKRFADDGPVPGRSIRGGVR